MIRVHKHIYNRKQMMYNHFQIFKSLFFNIWL